MVAQHTAEELARKVPADIAAEKIALPTGGAHVLDVSIEEHAGQRNVRVQGEILPVDPDASAIRFVVHLPERWNLRLLQFGGGGFDGEIVTAEHGGLSRTHWYGRPRAVDQGYVTCGSDSGHAYDLDDPLGPWRADWALNDEMLRNFAHEAMKKTHDVALELVCLAYGAKPERTYLSGLSNGGREALKCVQLYPHDYDGAVISFPAVNWIGMGLADVAHGRVLREVGEAGLFTPEEYRRFDAVIMGELERLNAARDGLVIDRDWALVVERKVRDAVARVVSEPQLRVIDAFASAYDPGCAIDPYMNVTPPYRVFAGVPLRDDFGPYPLNALPDVGSYDSGRAAPLGQGIVACQALRTAEFDIGRFDPREHVDELRAAASLLNATSPDLDAFAARGGKIIMEHGMCDNIIPCEMSVQYRNLLAERYGERLHDFYRFHLVPGYGHSLGRFDSGCDYLGALDAWVTEGVVAPEGLVATDRRDERDGRAVSTKPRRLRLAEWPGLATQLE